MASTQSGPVPAQPAPLPKPKVSVSQLRMLLVAVETDPFLYKAVKSDVVASFNIQKWLDMTNKLNDCLGGATLNAQNWKYVLRNWAENVKTGVDVMSKERVAYNKANPAITLKEAKELTRLERRFYRFLKEEEPEDIDNVPYAGKSGADKPKSDIAGPSGNGVKVRVELMNVSPLTDVNDENVCPDGPKKRTIHVKEDDPIDPADETKKVKVIFDEDLALDDEEAENKQILAMTLDRLQLVARVLEDHIASIQRRMDMIKDMYKNGCGDY